MSSISICMPELSENLINLDLHLKCAHSLLIPVAYLDF